MGEELNFEKFKGVKYLNKRIAEAIYAEENCICNPKESLRNLRDTLEQIVEFVYSSENIMSKAKENLDSKIKNEKFREYIGNATILEDLFFLKYWCNKASHPSPEISALLSIICLEKMYNFFMFVAKKNGLVESNEHFTFEKIPNYLHNRERILNSIKNVLKELINEKKGLLSENDKYEYDRYEDAVYRLAYKIGCKDVEVLKEVTEKYFKGVLYKNNGKEILNKDYSIVIDCAKKLLNYKNSLLDEEIYRCYYLIVKCLHEGGYGADKDDYAAYDYIQECLLDDNVDLKNKDVKKILEIKTRMPQKIIDEKTEKERLKKQIDEFENRFIKLEERMSAAEEDQQNKNQIEELKKEIEKLKEINNANKIEFKNEISDMKKIITDLQNKITAQTVLTKSLQNQIKKADENHKNLKNSYNELVKAVSDMKKNNKAPFEEVGKETEETINNRKQDSYTPSPEEDFNFDRKTGEIIKYTGRNSQVCIPGTISGIAVKSIGKNAFSENTNLTSVIIPDGIIKIGVAVFEGCLNLESVSIGKSVKIIDPFAFEGCKGLKDVTIPGSVTDIGSNAFKGCKGLKNVIIPDSVTSIGPFAFEGCKGLKNVIIPDGVTDIGSNAFNDCTGITKIRIPDSVKILGDRAFCNCSNLKTAYVPFELLNNTKDNELIKKVFPQNTKIIKI